MQKSVMYFCAAYTIKGDKSDTSKSNLISYKRAKDRINTVSKEVVMDAAYMAYRELRIAENKKRRLKIVRCQRITLALISFLIVFGIAFIFATLLLQAHDTDMTYKYYTQIDVLAGDTLDSIADKYLTGSEDTRQHYINEIIATNHLDEEGRILSGTSIVVPYYSREFK